MEKDFGIVIKEARLKKKLSMDTVSTSIGTSIAYLHKIESGIEFPSDQLLDNLCKALDLNKKKMANIIIDKKVEDYRKLLTHKYLKGKDK